MPQVTLPQATIRYHVMGPEDSPHPAVVFVHGILVDHRLWVGVAERLAREGFYCVLPDWPLGSHTVAVENNDALSPSGIAKMVHDFVTALGLNDVTLVGNDTGGGICQLAVDANPDDVGRLVLTNCDAFDKFPPFPFTVAFAMLRGPLSIRMLFGLMRIPAMRRTPLSYGLLLSQPNPTLTNSWLEPCRHDKRICRNLVALLRHVDNTDLMDVATRLPRFSKPVTVVWGMRDKAFTPSLGRRLANLFANSNVIEVADARTFVPLDDPDAVAGAVAAVGKARPLA